MHARVPRIIIDAQYIVDGKVLVLPITGKGSANLTLGKSINTEAITFSENFVSFFQYKRCVFLTNR